MSDDRYKPGPWEGYEIEGLGKAQGRRITPDFRCPCSGTYHLIEVQGSPDYVVMHTMEPCGPYLDLDVTAYLKYARKDGIRPLS